MWLYTKALRPSQLIKKLPKIANPTAVFYSKDGLLASAESARLDFVNQIVELLQDFGYSCVLVDGSSMDAPHICSDIALHIWMMEKPADCPPRSDLFHVFPSYLRGFWYFDTDGVRNNSSLKSGAFQPARMSKDWSKKVFADLRSRFVETGQTKFDQSPVGKFAPPKDCITVAVQSFAKPKFYDTYVQYPDLIHAAIEARGHRPIAIKPHPMLNHRAIDQLLGLHDPENGVFVEPYNLHELLSVSHCVVTRCSAVAVEAMLHRVPAIVAGEVDFRHCVTTIRDAADLRSAIDAVTERHIPYEKFLTWFFTQELFQPKNKAKSRERMASLLGLADT